MKKILLLVVIGTLILSGFGAGGINFEKKSNTKSIETEKLDGPKDYTHTVFVEVGTASWCPSCPGSNTAWHNIYQGGQYDFEYSELVIDKNSKANARMQNDYNLYWVPTSYFDGGEFVEPGTNYNIFYNNLDSCGARSVPDLDASLSANWMGDAKIEISLSIKNNDNNAYPGTLRVYVIELESTLWNDYSGHPYNHAFLDFPWNQAININSGDTFEDTKVWDGAAVGYPNIEYDNIQVILAVFDDSQHQAWSDPYHEGDDPEWAPFWAYYVDETVATLLEFNQPPEAPTIIGPTSGDAGVEYDFTFTTVDPENEDIYLWINWGDQTSDGWLGSYDSGEDIIFSHTYEEDGIYEITAKAKDINDNEGEWSDPHEIRIGGSPSAPTITGETNVKKGIAYHYTFNSVDPDSDNVKYYINWDDGDTTESSFNPSGSDYTIAHKWNQEGSYTITAYAEDDNGFIGPEGSLSITVTKTKCKSINFLYQQFLENHPNLFTILQIFLRFY